MIVPDCRLPLRKLLTSGPDVSGKFISNDMTNLYKLRICCIFDSFYVLLRFVYSSLLGIIDFVEEINKLIKLEKSKRIYMSKV